MSKAVLGSEPSGEVAADHPTEDVLPDDKGYAWNRTAVGVSGLFVVLALSLMVPNLDSDKRLSWMSYVLAVSAAIFAFGPALVRSGARPISPAEIMASVLALAAGGVTGFASQFDPKKYSKDFPNFADIAMSIAVLLLIAALINIVIERKRLEGKTRSDVAPFRSAVRLPGFAQTSAPEWAGIICSIALGTVMIQGWPSGGLFWVALAAAVCAGAGIGGACIAWRTLQKGAALAEGDVTRSAARYTDKRWCVGWMVFALIEAVVIICLVVIKPGSLGWDATTLGAAATFMAVAVALWFGLRSQRGR